MSISVQLSHLFELPVTKAFQEASNKLENTYLFINDSLKYVIGFSESHISYNNVNGDMESIASAQVKSLETWVPETGIYFQQGTRLPVYLERRALRQWKKSYCENLYLSKYLEASFPIVTVDPNVREDFFVNKKKEIYYHTKVVGYIRDSKTVVCTAPYLAQELRDWFGDLL